MSRRQRTLEINVVSDIRDLKRSLGQVERQTQTTSQKLSRAGSVIAAGFAGVAGSAVLRVVGDLNKLGVQADAIRNRFGTVFGDLSGEMQRWAEDVNDRFGTSVETVMDLANGIGDLLVPIGFTRQEAADLAREVLNTANALSEWSGGAVTVEDASERVRKALLGERESIEELGVKILQSDVNARLAAEGQSKLTGQEKARAEALATLNIIQEKSTDAISAYKDGANEALIEQKKLNAAIEDGKQALADFIEQEVSSAQREVGKFAGALQDAGVVFDSWGGHADAAGEGQRSWLDRIIESNPALRDFADLLEWASDTLDEQAEKVRVSEENQRLINEEWDQGREAAIGLGGALRGELIPGFNEARDAGERVNLANDPLVKIRANAIAAAGGLRSLAQAQLELVDPAFRQLQAEGRLRDAQKARNDLLKDRKATEQDIEDANFKVLQAQAELNVVTDDTTKRVGDDLLPAFEDLARQAGIIDEHWQSTYRSIRDITQLRFIFPEGTIPEGSNPAGGTWIDPIAQELERRRREVVEAGGN